MDAPTRRLTDAQQALAARYVPLAHKIANQAARRRPALADEFEGAAPLALCQAAATFRPGGGARFSTHATCRILGAIQDTYRQCLGVKGFRRRNLGSSPAVLSLHFPIGHDDRGLPVPLGDTIPADEDPVGWGLEYQDELAALARRLPLGPARVVRLLYGRADLSTVTAVAREIGGGKSWVSQLHGRAVEQLTGKA